MTSYLNPIRMLGWLKRVGSAKRNVTQVTIFAPTASPYFRTGDIDYVGGAERQLFSLARMLAESGIDTRVLTINVASSDNRDEANLQIIQVWRSDDPKVKRAWGLVRHILAAPSPIYVRTPSLVNALIILGCRAMGKRVVLGIASDLNCILHPGASARNFWTKVIMRTASQVIAQTQDQQILIKTNFKVDAALFPNVIRDVDFAAARDVPFDDRDIDVTWIGALGQRKGVEDVLVITDRLPDRKFAVLGGTLPGHKKYADEILARFDQRSNVTAPGFVQPSEIPLWLSRTKVLLHTSPLVLNELTKEGFPNVFLEAWSAGVSVVSLYADPDQLLARENLGHKCSSTDEAVTIINNLAEDATNWETSQKLTDAYIESRTVRNAAVRDAFLAILLGRHSQPAIRVIDIQVPDEADGETSGG